MLERKRAAGPLVDELGRGRAAKFIPPVLLAIGCIAVFALVTHLSEGMWFLRDDWDYLMKRGTVPEGDRGWFAPYGGHWVTLPIVLFRIVFAFFGMKTYCPTC